MGKILIHVIKTGRLGFTGLIYPPGSMQILKRLFFLGVAAANGCFYATHLRDEGEYLIEAVNEAKDCRRSPHISHHKAIGKLNRGKVKDTLLMEDAREKALILPAICIPIPLFLQTCHQLFLTGLGTGYFRTS